ncbi:MULTISPECIES: plasmid replication DNA-binding protein [unclassified Acinetobacter]|uniref:plasmid replication DNA-binding protein n=2 Tax=unclassified Acinetobacter TaxID=196816 RepID=UPI0015D28444|nr:MULTISPECIES: plasmid replication DNA-binding protein [unclassified Acinetobacter]UUS62570.1 plasmid replication DNA-binding protein [Acinetobacter sp. YH16056_T]
MKKMTVGELAKLYGLNRQSIYKRINKGDLSKGSDGKIDFSEAIRVFGEPSERNKNVTTLQSTQVQQQTEVDTLRLQVEMLQKQLRKAEETEDFLKEQIKTKDSSINLLQTLLTAPKSSVQGSVEKQQSDPVLSKLPELEKKQEEHLIPKPILEEEKRPKRKGLFSRVVSAVFDE